MCHGCFVSILENVRTFETTVRMKVLCVCVVSGYTKASISGEVTILEFQNAPIDQVWDAKIEH